MHVFKYIYFIVYLSTKQQLQHNIKDLFNKMLGFI